MFVKRFTFTHHFRFHNEETLLLLLFLYSHIGEGRKKDSRHAKRMLCSNTNGLLSTPSFIFHLTDSVTIYGELNETPLPLHP